MEFRVLGPLEVSDRGRQVPLGGPKQQLVLAQLLLHANEVVSTDRLIDELWGENPPEAARNALQSYVSRLRQALGDAARIEGRGRGYVLHVEAEELDAIRFQSLVDEARDAFSSDPELAHRLLDEALRLWRGPPLAGLDEGLALKAEAARLEELRLAALEDRLRADLALGHHRGAAAELETLVAAQPLREGLWGQLMLALYRSGRQADALEAYRRARTILADELGLDPSQELQHLHGQILRQDPALAPESERLRGYRLLERIGAGAFGVVHRAIQPHVDREVAVKVIHPELANDARFVRRFEAEAQLVARLEHPRIVPLYDYWREPGAAYLVMRWLRGGSLRQALAEGPLPPKLAVRVVQQVASGLAAAHRRGVVHRDVKPANVLLDEDGNAYLSDFGIAAELTGGEAPPSPDSAPYQSPEQLRGEPATPQADVYSLGVVLHESLAGPGSFAVPRAALPDGVPHALDEVVARATAWDPADRYSSAEELAGDLREALGRRRARPVGAARRNPYKGLRPFQEADTDDFHGREALVESITARLADGARFLVVVGGSGSGKSSLVRAGLVPALRRGAVVGSADWFAVEMYPGAHPLEELEAALLRIAVNPPPSLIEQLERDELGLARAVKRCLPDGDSELLLVVDQLEELFTLVEEEPRRAHFLASVAAAVDDPRSRVRLIATVRADFYDRPLAYPRFAELVREGVETIVPLTAEELERAVSRPAEQEGVACEPGLVAAIVGDVAGQPAPLPLVQYALTELFERADGGVLGVEAYHAIGGVSGAVARRAEELYDAAGAAGREALRQLFLRLIAFGEGGEQTRRRVTRAELGSLEVDQAALDRVVDAFGQHRLLSFDRDPQSREPTIEVAHEALLSAWGRLRGWLDGAGEDVRTGRQLAAAAAEWDGARREPSFLLRGTRLETLATWAEETSLALSRGERDYLAASVAARDAELAEEEARRDRERALERRSVRRLRALAAVLAAGLVAAGVLAFAALDQRREARDQARVATARELASAALASLEADPERSILLALEAVGMGELREAEEALHQAVQASRVVASVAGHFGAAFSPDGGRLATSAHDGGVMVWDAASGERLASFRPHGRQVITVAFTPDGDRLVTASEDGTAKLLDAATGAELRTFAGHGARVYSMDLAGDGRVLATRSEDGTVRLWDLASGAELHVLRHERPLGLHFSPDGRLLAVGDEGGARLWQVSSGALVRVFGRDTIDVRFSPDGTRLATGDPDALVRLWDVATGRLLRELPGHESSVETVDFSPEGTMLASGSSDGTVRLWEADTGRQLLLLTGYGGSVEHLTFSPDGRVLAAAGTAGITKLWDVTPQGGRDLLTLDGHEQFVLDVAYSPAGDRLATASVDGAAGVWDARSGERLLSLRDHDGPVGAAVFSPDGSRLATGGADGTARIRDAATGEVRLTLSGHGAPVTVVWSPAGDHIATSGFDGTARLWDGATGEQLHVLRSEEPSLNDVAVSPDGRLVAGAGQKDTIPVWDAATGRLARTLRGHTNGVVGLAFDPNGPRLASASPDGTVRLWNAATGELLHTLSAHAAGVFGVAFSADGTRLASSSFDGVVKVWDPDGGTELLALGGHVGGATALAFDPTGTRLAVGGDDGAVRVYTLRLEELVELARARVTRTLTDEECRTYLHLPRCPGSAG